MVVSRMLGKTVKADEDVNFLNLTTEQTMATTRKPTKPKTSADLKAQLLAAKKRLADLEKRAYAEELSELIKSTNIVADFAKIQARVTGIPPIL